MTILDLETMGYYEPGLLHLRVNTDRDIRDLNKVMAEDRLLFSTFLHEYIHFLQDVTTTVGLTYSSFYISVIKDVNYAIINDGVAEFEIPYKFTNDYNTVANMQLRAIYSGSAKVESYARYDRYETAVVKVEDRDGSALSVNQYVVCYYDGKMAEKKFTFGITCLKEYVAHTLQSRFDNTTDHPVIPYLIAELVVEKEYAPLLADRDYLLALCDASLMTYHPAQIFFNTLERMKKVQFEPTSVDDVYDFTYKDITLRGQERDFTVVGLYDYTRTLTISEFENALQADIFKSNLDWIRYILDQGSDLRKANRGFITKLVDEQGNLSSLFYQIFATLGTPFFTNNMSVGGIVPPKNLTAHPDQPFQLLVFKQILNLYGGNTCCTLHDFCTNSPGERLTDDLCLTAPWERGSHAQLCPFGQLWKTWALNGQLPIRKK